MELSNRLVWLLLAFVLSLQGLCSELPTDTLDASEAPRATNPVSANDALPRHSPPLYVIGLIIVGIFLLGATFCWCCLRKSSRFRRFMRSPGQDRITQWVANNSVETREEKVSARRARIQEDLHGRTHDDPQRAGMMQELRRGSLSPTVLHRTPTLHSPSRHSFPISPPRIAHVRPERSPV